MDFPEHPFWDFSLKVYRAEGVGEACLVLQDRFGIDVNVMLFCLWLGSSGRGVMSDDDMAALGEAVGKWHADVVRGLRAVRQVMKTGFPEVPEKLRERLRGDIQAAEINAEHLEQLLLAAAVDRPPAGDGLDLEQRAGDAGRNFKLYLATLGAKFEPSDTVHFAHIMGQAFPGLAPEAALDVSEILM